MSLRERYESKPILLIVENYVLAVIGELSEESATETCNIVQRVWSKDDDWMKTVRGQLGWDTSIDDLIRKDWGGYQEAARQQKVEGSSREFAMIVADAMAQSNEQSP